MTPAMSVQPRFSVVTAVFNGARHLEACLQSVANQVGVDVEQIVIDGGSTDGSLEILRRWSGHLAFWRSEPDAGIADAMNKGIAHATGDWILFVHADDYLASPDALARAVALLEDGIDVASFPVLFGQPGRLEFTPPRPAGWLTNFKLGMCHQGVMVRRSLFERLGAFDLRYRICMDYDFLLRAYRAGVPFRTFREPVLAVMTSDGISSRQDWSSLARRFAEERSIHAAHSRSATMALVYGAYWKCYLAYRKCRHWLS